MLGIRKEFTVCSLKSSNNTKLAELSADKTEVIASYQERQGQIFKTFKGSQRVTN